MVLEQVLNLFEETTKNKKGNRDPLLNTIDDTFSSNAASLKDFPILILQSTFLRKQKSSSTSLNFQGHYKLLWVKVIFSTSITIRHKISFLFQL